VIGGVFLLVLLGGVIAAVVAALRRSSHHPGGSGDHPPGEFRRAAELTVLAVAGGVATAGVAGLLTRLFDALAGVPLDADVAAAARALALTFIAGPISLLGWWWTWRRIGPAQRPSLVWSLFLVVTTTVSLLVWSIAGVGAFAGWLTGPLHRAGLATGLAWAGAWVGLRWVQRRSDRRPSRLVDVSPVLGSIVGMALAVIGAVTALQLLFGRAVESWADVVTLGPGDWWRPVLRWTVLAAGGSAIWWLHWVRDGARRETSPLAHLGAVVSGVVTGAVLTLVGAGMVLFDLSRLALGEEASVATMRPGLGLAVALALVGGLLWSGHARTVARRPAVVRRAAGLALSGIGLVAAATGLGIVVNAGLGAVGSTLAGSGMRDLLCGGLSVLAVGTPLWVAAWRPGVQIKDPEQRHWSGRQTYLVIVFGASALTALGTLIAVTYQIFESLLREPADQDLLEQVRVSLGLLVSTVLVAAYHFPVWRRDRTIRERAAGPPVGEILLVAGSAASELGAEVRARTGAQVRVWTTAVEPVDPPDADAVCAALGERREGRVLVLTGDRGRVEVIPLRS